MIFLFTEIHLLVSDYTDETPVTWQFSVQYFGIKKIDIYIIKSHIKDSFDETQFLRISTRNFERKINDVASEKRNAGMIL